MEWFGSWTWLAVVGGGAALLGLGLAFAGGMWATRDKRKDAQAESGARRIYDQAREEPTKQDDRVAEREKTQ